MFTCQIDQQTFATEKEMHNYIARRLKMKIADYYHKYVPRHDLLTHQLIEFKNKEFYDHALFNKRENLIEYFKKHPTDKDSIIECIKLRKEMKNLRFAPSTVEARTCILPTPILVLRLGFFYNQICKDIGLIPRYDYGQLLVQHQEPLELLVDTREQLPLPIKAAFTSSKLDFGDYTSSSHFNNVFVERKSLPDLCGTLSAGYERFQREIKRAADMGSYLVVCVEEDLTHINTVGKTPNTMNIKASPDFLGVRMRALCQEFDNIQFLFIKGRVQMTEIVETLFRLKNDVKTLDLQFMYDSKLL